MLKSLQEELKKEKALKEKEAKEWKKAKGGKKAKKSEKGEKKLLEEFKQQEEVIPELDMVKVLKAKQIKHYALENPFTDRSFKGLKKLYPFSSKNYINTSIDDISKMECFTKPKII